MNSVILPRPFKEDQRLKFKASLAFSDSVSLNPAIAQVFTAALFISLMHLRPWWPHAVIVLPSFCIQAASYLYWRRISWKTAFWVLVWIHSLDNFIPALDAFAAYTTRHHL